MASSCLGRFRSPYVFVLAALAGVPAAAPAQSCPNEWSSAFPGDGGFDEDVNALVPFQGELCFAGKSGGCTG
jgi:hypothetical protein